MQLRPESLELDGGGDLIIAWNDGSRRHYAVQQLRDQCPCATCREQRSAPPAAAGLLPVLSMEETQPLKIADMKPVGSYAYGIVFSDGHDSGIFTLESLAQLGRPIEPID